MKEEIKNLKTSNSSSMIGEVKNQDLSKSKKVVDYLVA